MFRLILLTAREIERRAEWTLPLSYFAFWTVRLGGWLPRFDRCASCGTPFGSGPAYHAAWSPDLLCEKCKRSGMKPLGREARNLAERFAGERLDRVGDVEPLSIAAAELREAAFDWIEHHTEKRIRTRQLLETN
jgi:recombinational DNA repair protein (RecF pathway)